MSEPNERPQVSSSMAYRLRAKAEPTPAELADWLQEEAEAADTQEMDELYRQAAAMLRRLDEYKYNDADIDLLNDKIAAEEARSMRLGNELMIFRNRERNLWEQDKKLREAFDEWAQADGGDR